MIALCVQNFDGAFCVFCTLRYKESAASFMEIIRILESGCKVIAINVPENEIFWRPGPHEQLCLEVHEGYSFSNT